MNELCTTALSSPPVKSQELEDLSFVLQDIWHTQHQEPTRAAIVQCKTYSQHFMDITHLHFFPQVLI